MEFLQLLLVLIAVILVIIKPEKEKLAFGLVVASWLFMLIMYIGAKSSNLLTNMNL
ncbi:disulfide bond formation protein Dba [Campylobacter mucosalis]|uniref:disulfide bond formation protein Dba n=1 Tax=Campylobacter mucosalis TaxID=202 RepID=UPI00146FEA82|nr:dihydroneopterin aldolase [Campylobacter mucosalis]